MKIAFIWYWDKASEVYPSWRDGLRAAMEEIAREHDVKWFLDKTVPNPEDHIDALIFWDDSNSAFFSQLDNYNCKKALCLTTDPQNFDNLRKLDAVYCESEPILEAVKRQGIRAIKAFGTDTDFFTPDPTIEKDIEYFYPATFSPWKRQSEIAYLGDKLLCVGTIQPDGVEEYQACVKAGVKVEEGYFPVETIRDYYQRTKRIIIPAVHGSERTVLEAMACGLLPVVTNDNKRAKSYIYEYLKSGEDNTRDFVINNYSHKLYAQQIMKGIQ